MNTLLYPLKYHVKKSEKLTYKKAKQKNTDFEVQNLPYSNENILAKNPNNHFEQEEFHTSKIVNENWDRLVSNLSDPTSIFLKKVGFIGQKIEDEIKIKHTEFYILIEEVCRDGKLTKAEKAFILQKAKEYGIPKLKVKILLKDNLEINHTYQILIDEVCKDGKITEEEYDFLIEKAKEYNIPKRTVTASLDKGLLKTKNINSLISNKNFYELILYYFFIEFYLPKSKFVFSILDFGKMLILNPSKINKLDSFLKKLHKKVYKRIKKDFKGVGKIFRKKKIHTFLSELELEILSIDETKIKLEKHIQAKNNRNLGNTINIYDKTYHFEYYKSKTKPLFYHVFEDNKDKIFLNKAHRLTNGRRENDIDIIKIISTAIYCSKFDMYDNKIDVFINKFSHYIDQITEME